MFFLQTYAIGNYKKTILTLTTINNKKNNLCFTFEPNTIIKMNKKAIALFSLILTTLFVNAQTTRLILSPYVRLPLDSIERKNLIVSIDEYLIAAQKPNELNTLILPSEKIETFIQLDEINGIEKSNGFNDNFFYKPYLTNVTLIEKDNYLIKVSYIGINEKTPILRASFELIANKNNNSFLFSSPLIRNTINWQTLTLGNNVFHYQKTINKTKVDEFNKLTNQFDKKLKSTNKKSEFYLCSNFIELQKIIGVDYKLDYNGVSENDLSSTFGDKKLIVLGSNSSTFDNFDPHDLWHDRLSLVISRKKVNKSIDEACAYLYGGSWGISWKEIFNKFKLKIASNKDANWIEYNEKQVNFGDSKEKHLMVDYVVNALIVQKIEKEKGFEGVWEFLNCGPIESGNENYYKVLEKLTGITKTNYNVKVWELINSQK